MGPTPGVREAVAAALQTPVAEQLPSDLGSGDLVVVEAGASGDALPGGNAFSACCAWKTGAGVAVYLVVAADDRYGPGLARFCMADGHLVWDPVRAVLLGSEILAGTSARPARTSVDELLARLEGTVAADEGRAMSALQRLLLWERQDTLMHRLQDPETGLFDGPYASLKLDEEFKRAQRMHLPLSLILLDIGTAAGRLPEPGPARREMLAEVASIFLNESRDIDVLSRFTETTFLFLLPGTGPDGAELLARRMIAALRGRQFGSSGLEPRVGLASVPATGIADRKAFVAVAEACLDRAREGAGDGGLCSSWE